MPVLHAVWMLSLALAGAALAWMAALILARLLRDRLDRRRRATRRQVTEAYLRLMRGDAGALEALRPYRREADVLAEALLEMLDMVRGGDRDRLVEALGSFGLDGILCERVRRGPAARRLAAIEALASFPTPQTQAAVRLAGRRAGGETRIAAVRALRAMDARIDLDLLAGDVVRRREPWSRALADTLKLIAETQAQDCARLLQREDLPAPLRAMLASALGGAGDYSVLPVLCGIAQAGPPAVRAASLEALGRLMHPAAEDVVARGVDDADWQVRAAAAGAAGAAGFSALAPRLSDRLCDPVWPVRFRAAEALAQLGPPGLARLRAAVRSGADDAARAASLTLAERGLR